jgi:UTP--glucose-1-phosphate uridylyltransferase
MRIARDQSGRYGVFAGTAVDARTMRVRSVVEKPAPADAPSDLASVHGYVLDPAIFDVLAACPPGRDGEVWLADAVNTLAGSSPVWAVELEGTRYDAGERAGYVAAFVDEALARPDTGPALRDHLRRSGWREPGGR